MAEDKNIKTEGQTETMETPANQQTEQENVVKLAKPYVFEGKEYPEIDLSGLDKLTIKDAIDAQRQLFGEQEVAAAVLCETTTAFARTIAVKATELPIEFFKLMPRGISRRVAAAVRGYLNVDSTTENHVIHLVKPCHYKGKQYQEIDLNGIADLNKIGRASCRERV